jgi:hypothetical protein
VVGTVKTTKEALEEEAQGEGVVLIKTLSTTHLREHGYLDQVKSSSTTISINKLVNGLDSASESLRRMILVQAYHMMRVCVIFNGIIYALI